MAISDTLNGGMAQYQFSNTELLKLTNALHIATMYITNQEEFVHYQRLKQTINSILAARNSRG